MPAARNPWVWAARGYGQRSARPEAPSDEFRLLGKDTVMYRAGILAALATAAVIGSASAQTPPAPAAPAAAPAGPAVETPREADPVVAIVNGETIRASELVYLYQTLGEGVRQMAFEMLYPQLLAGSIERKVAAQKAREAKVDDRADVKQKFDFWHDRVLEETLLNETVEAQMTPAALQDAYKALIANDAGQEEIRAKHILFANPEAAIAVVKELDAGGNFDQILDRVTQQGIGRGGPIDYFRRDGVIQAFSDAAFKMRPGEYTTNPVQSEFGFHIIMVVDRRVSPPPPFADVEGDLRNDLGGRLVEEFYAKLVAGAQVQKFNFDGTPMN